MEKLNFVQFILIQQQKTVIIDNCINDGSDWIVELIESQCINISTYRPLSGSS